MTAQTKVDNIFYKNLILMNLVLFLIIISDLTTVKGCRWNDLDIATYKNIDEQIKHAWPNVMGPVSSRESWIQSYREAGGCIIKTFNEDNNCNPVVYFQLALSLYERFNIEAILKAKDIVPSTNKGYSMKGITDALADHLKHRAFVLVCGQPQEDNTQLLVRIKIFLDISTMDVSDGVHSHFCDDRYHIRYLPNDAQ